MQGWFIEHKFFCMQLTEFLVPRRNGTIVHVNDFRHLKYIQIQSCMRNTWNETWKVFFCRV